MIEIITDTSSMLHPIEAQNEHLHCLPLHIQAGNTTYLDYLEISPEEIIQLCQKGEIPKTSQPSIGEKLELYDELLENPEAEILDITIADGLSGTYQSALMAAQSCKDPDRVHVFNSKTLAGPQQAMVRKAAAMRDAGKNIDEILNALNAMKENEFSFLFVADFDYLGRSGRVSSVVGKTGAFMKIVPVIVKKEDGTSLILYKPTRTFKKAIDTMVSGLNKKGVNADWTFYICHSSAPEIVNYAKEKVEQTFPGSTVHLQTLCSGFMVHAGPGSMAIQAVKIPA